MPNSIAIIVEDDVILAGAYRLSLFNAGFEVHLAYSMTQFMAWLTQHTPELIVLDLNLPDGLGLDYVPHLRRTLPATTRLIALTGNTRLVEAYGDEFDLVLLKPVSMRQLQELSMRLCTPAFTEFAPSLD
jgi:DNA-binding response OmpR family regulator